MDFNFLQINMLKPFQGWEEISPNELQNGVKQVLQNALKGIISYNVNML